MWPNWRNGLIASLLTTTLAACSTTPAAPPLRPSLPPAPATFGLPVPVPVPHEGDNAFAVAARNAAALKSANQRLTNDGAFYAAVRKAFSK